MSLRLPLAAKLLGWLLLNLLLLLLLVAALSGETGFGWQTLLSDPARERLFAIGEDLGRELSAEPAAQWPATLADYGNRYGARFECCERQRPPGDRPDPGPPPGDPGDDRSNDPTHDPGRPPFTGSRDRARPPPPPEGRGPEPDFGPGFGSGREPPPGGHDDRPPPDDDGRDGRPARGSADPADRIGIAHRAGGGFGLRIPVLVGEGMRRQPMLLTASVDDFGALVRLLGLRRWLLLPAAGLLLSVLLWLPMLGYLTRSIARITQATARIAQGHFDVRLPARSRDELGALSASVNLMAGRLQNLVGAQRTFLADVAHEVTSPLSRLQIGLGILESRVAAPDRALLADLQEDTGQMSGLVHELLLFSRADGEFAQRSQPTRFALAGVVDEVRRRDAGDLAIEVELADAIDLVNHRALLLRALSNLVRNARRYAGDAGPITVRAERQQDEVVLAVLDRGPGVPAAALAQLGEPFFRVESARTPGSGGFGLGLAIVRRCALACGGQAHFANREGGGFVATLRVPASLPVPG